MTDSPDLRPTRELLERVVGIVHEAGRAVLDVYGRDDFAVEKKADDSPLTAADLASQKVLAAGLAEIAPGTPAVSEEATICSPAERATWRQAWCVDPLDGTKEFVSRNGEFTVNVALLENGRPIAGIVHAPVLERTWFGAEGLGAWEQAKDGEITEIRADGTGQDQLVVAASRSHPSPLLQAVLDVLPPHRLRALGSSLKICLVATGEVDLYPRLGPTMEWDTAAADAVLRAAGGRMVRLDDEPLAYNKADLLNPFFLALSAALPEGLPEKMTAAARDAQS